MKAETEKRTILKWNSKKFGLCEATIWDGVLTDFRFCQNGSSVENGIYTANVEFLRELHINVGELLAFLDKEKK